MAATGMFERIGRRFAYWRALREEIRTERVMNALPRAVRKDIGWPDLYAGCPIRNAQD